MSWAQTSSQRQQSQLPPAIQKPGLLTLAQTIGCSTRAGRVSSGIGNSS